jgi:hypothetical protein
MRQGVGNSYLSPFADSDVFFSVFVRDIIFVLGGMK